MGSAANAVHREPWNKGKIVGQKALFKLKGIWALRVRLQMENRVRELALFNLGRDAKGAVHRVQQGQSRQHCTTAALAPVAQAGAPPRGGRR